jgi:hypothetical protein
MAYIRPEVCWNEEWNQLWTVLWSLIPQNLIFFIYLSILLKDLFAVKYLMIESELILLIKVD